MWYLQMLRFRLLNKFFYISQVMEPVKTLTREGMIANRELLENLIKRRFVYSQAFEIHGGCGGLYDYGPIGCAIATNLEQLWRDHFILEEDMLEIRGTCVTPIQVLQASGHVGKFTDLMVRDVKTNQGIRADKLLVEFLTTKLNNPKEKLTEEERKELQHYLINADGYKQEEMTTLYQKLKIKSPETGNELTKPEPFSLMFQTSIGPNGDLVGFLRPETAQGIFVDFGKLLEYNGGRMPFAAAQIGLGFRNEIAPRNGLIRVREFMMAEIEHFVDPEDKSHPKFQQYRDLQLPLFSQPDQQAGKDTAWTPIGKAVDQKMVHNQTLGYFLARTYLFLTAAGVNKDCMRFRQLSKDERAHYAQDCWDCEILTSLGWIECVGTADRSAYDLEHHSQATGQKLLAARKFKQARPKDQVTINLNKGELAKIHKKDLQILTKYIDHLDEKSKAELMKQFEEKGEKELTLENVTFKLTKDNANFTKKTVNVMEEKYTPHVIEPSFGLGRIIYSILEHSFRARFDKEGKKDEKRTFLALPPKIAPVKVSLLPLVNNSKFEPYIKDLKKNLKKSLISCKVDDSGQTIGKRYARTDEIGIPFAITIDFDTLNDQTVTLRELMSSKQVRIPVAEVVKVLFDLSEEFITWNDVLTKYPAFVPKDEEANEETK